LVGEPLRDGPQIVGCGTVRGLVIGEGRFTTRHDVVGRRFELMHDRPVGCHRRENLR
jgi:hypothetical protein